MSGTRDELNRLLATSPGEALDRFRALANAMTGEPPAELVKQLIAADDPESTYHKIAREWERGALAGALWKALENARTPSRRRIAASLVKRFPARAILSQIAERAQSRDEDVQVRRWLIQALDQLAFAHEASWADLRAVMSNLLADPEPVVRESAAGALGSLPRTEEIETLLTAHTSDPSRDVADTAQRVLGERSVK